MPSLSAAIGDDSDAAPPPPTALEWNSGSVAVFEPAPEPTSCGVTVTPQTLGIAHPVLPCGAKLVLEYQGRQAQADVVENGPVEAGRAFELTPALAQQLGVAGTCDGPVALRGIGMCRDGAGVE